MKRYEQVPPMLAAGKTHKEIAKELGITVQSVYSADWTARKKGLIAPTRKEVKAVKPAKTKLHNKPSTLFFLARLLDEEIVQSIRDTGHVSSIARTALVLTHEVAKLEKNS